jgi:ubiquinone/menaquinone biosynthesis C-methylase UbiE
MPVAEQTSELKSRVREFWDQEPCGTRYLDAEESFESHAAERYRLEPFIKPWADFSTSAGKSVLEIGVGMGADYLEWLKAGAIATGVDLSASSLEKARGRCLAAGYSPDLRLADAEHLPFADNTFDIVYSYGVLHHSPDTARCITEAFRVLKAGGRARIMLYQHPSLTGLMLWLAHGLVHGQSLRQSVFEHLESPGTKTFTRSEVEGLFQSMEDVRIDTDFSPGDLLAHLPSAKYQGALFKAIWRLYPRWLVRRVGKRWGLFLLISARKPLER